MITINVFLEIDSPKKEEYLEFVNNLVKSSQKEKGCLFYGHFSNVEDSTQYVIVENWENQKALDLHNKTEHLKSFVQNINQFLIEDCKISVSF